MNRDRSDPDAHHAAVAELLAWYVNGTLSDPEGARVAEHLAACADCRDQVAFWRGLAPALAELEAAPAPHPAQLRALLARLDAAPSGEPSRGGASGSWPSSMRWLFAVQAAAIVVLAVGLGVAQRRPPSAPFHTLTTAAAPPATTRLRVVFDERASERELRALLVPLGAAIVGGPSPLGVYTIELPSGAELAATVAALRTQPLVRFAEPLAPEDGNGP